jgi:hypothetical protein
MSTEKPSFEEGAESSMTATQKELSRQREESAQKVEAATGMPGYLEVNDGFLVGKIKGHTIKIEASGEMSGGTVDGIEINISDAAEIVHKYLPLAYRLNDNVYADKGNEEWDMLAQDRADKEKIKQEDIDKALDDLLPERKSSKK